MLNALWWTCFTISVILCLISWKLERQDKEMARRTGESFDSRLPEVMLIVGTVGILIAVLFKALFPF